MTASNIFDTLEGQWQLRRTIVDRFAGDTNHAHGTASFVRGAAAHQLIYTETGIVQLVATGKELRFQRSYIYKLEHDQLVIYLNDGVTKGKVFQALTPLDDSCQFKGEDHLCRSDVHSGHYRFVSATEFEIEQVVKGPGTGLLITSRFLKR